MIEQFGAFGVFLLMIPESACVPIPSEVTLLFSGVAVHQGWMSPPVAILAATAGNLIGSLLAYAVGATRLLDRVPVARLVVSRWEGLLDRYGVRAVFAARLLPLARTFVSLPAGARRVPLASFIALTALGCGMWAAGFVIVGSLAAGAWAAISSLAGRVLLVIGLITVALTIARGGAPAAGARRIRSWARYGCGQAMRLALSLRRCR